jgi:hypothetical protein
MVSGGRPIRHSRAAPFVAIGNQLAMTHPSPPPHSPDGDGIELQEPDRIRRSVEANGRVRPEAVRPDHIAKRLDECGVAGVVGDVGRSPLGH